MGRGLIYPLLYPQTRSRGQAPSPLLSSSITGTLKSRGLSLSSSISPAWKPKGPQTVSSLKQKTPSLTPHLPSVQNREVQRAEPLACATWGPLLLAPHKDPSPHLQLPVQRGIGLRHPGSQLRAPPSS